MASLHQIEVANFLCEDYENSKEWFPLYRGVTFRLFGQSTAFQIDNGGGKTSLSDAWLYLLSRDRRLKPKVEDRVAPADKGWTHIRIEFIEKPLDENILQSDLITLTPEDAPGTTYVIGFCWNRGKDPFFYRYQGTLNDVPCYKQTDNRLELVSNEVFRKTVERMPGAVWNRWGSISEWHEEVGLLTNMDIVKQNVEFQVAGAGDYSAMITKVKKRSDERWDEAFFRELIAPELLRQPVSEDGDVEDTKFENILLKTLKPTAAALVDIAKANAELANVENALHAFDTVESKAETVVVANTAYQEAINSVRENAAVIYNLAVRSPLPGVPTIPADAQWLNDKPLMGLLYDMVVDREHGILVTESGLGKLLGVPASEFNRGSGSQKRNFCSNDVIDFRHFLHRFEQPTASTDSSQSDSQDNEPVEAAKIEVKARKERRAVSGFNLETALEMVALCGNRPIVGTADSENMLKRAFGVAAEIDTNPYRREARQLQVKHGVLKSRESVLYRQNIKLDEEKISLEKSQTEARENELAYENFVAKSGYYPEELRQSPAEAKNWAHEQHQDAQTKHGQHKERVGRLSSIFASWTQLHDQHGITPLAEVLEAMDRSFSEVQSAANKASNELSIATGQKESKEEEFLGSSRRLMALRSDVEKLQTLKAFEPSYREVFGDAEPDTLNPQQGLKDANRELQAATRKLSEARRFRSEIDANATSRRLYVECFGEVDPNKVDPSGELNRINGEVGALRETLAEYQSLEESLQLFEDGHPNVLPKDWLAGIERQRTDLHEKDRLAGDEIARTEQEIADMEAFAVADDRVYSDALHALTASGCSFKRLHEVLAGAVTGDRLEECFTLFSAALSAPVVATLDDADNATALLEHQRKTVPVFLLEPLLQFAQGGTVTVAENGLVHNFLIGRKTRQVSILLNPGLLAEEKENAEAAIQRITKDREEWARQLRSIAPDSASVLLAIKADEAVRRGSRRICDDARSALKKLEQPLAKAQRNAQPDAMAAVVAMKSHIQAGGDLAYQKLVEETIPELEMAEGKANEKVDLFNRQTTDEALEALLSMRSFKKLGGNQAMEKQQEELTTGERAQKALEGEIADLGARIKETLKPAAAQAQSKLSDITAKRAEEREPLICAIEFETNGDLAFMQNEPGLLAEIDRNLQSMILATENVDFERAQRYANSLNAGNRSYAEQLAEWQTKKNDTEGKLSTVRTEKQGVEIRLDAIEKMIPRVHQTIFDLVGKLLLLDRLPDSVRNTLPATLPAEVREYAETVAIAALGSEPGTSEEVTQAWHNLYVTVGSEITINAQGLADTAQKLNEAQQSFSTERTYYCQRARSGEIKGLNSLEIELIENAKTVERIRRFRELRGVIQKQIDDLHVALDKITKTMEVNRLATIENLSKLAKQASNNKTTLDRVMSRHAHAKFEISCDIADEAKIQAIIESLILEIQDREKALREKKASLSNAEIRERDSEYRNLIHRKIYSGIFTETKVEFVHDAIRSGKTLFTEPGERLSTGQHTALAMMWLVRHAEYVQTRVAMMHGTRREQKKALRGSQRVMFFDGLFSNLSNESYINAAFHGLKDVGDNFQLIGLIHNPHYVNNPQIFPTHLIGKRVHGQTSDRTFMAFKPWQADNGMLFATTAVRQNEGSHA